MGLPSTLRSRQKMVALIETAHDRGNIADSVDAIETLEHETKVRAHKNSA